MEQKKRGSQTFISQSTSLQQRRRGFQKQKSISRGEGKHQTAASAAEHQQRAEPTQGTSRPERLRGAGSALLGQGPLPAMPHGWFLGASL